MSTNPSDAMTDPLSAATTGRGFVASLLPVMAVVLVVFLITGLSLPVVPLHVHHGLGLGEFIVGLVVGSQFAASLISRPLAGHYADNRGAKRGVSVGLLTAAASGMLYLLSVLFTDTPVASVAILLLGRALLGAAESFLITGAVSWGLGIVQSGNAGRVIAWVGMAMFVALGLGAPIGTTLYDHGGFAAVAWATMLAPLVTFGVVARLPVVPAHPGMQSGFLSIAGKVWLPGLGAAFSSVGFGAVLAFGSLLFAGRGWSPVWLAFTAYAAGLIAARAVFGHLPDRLGGAKVALAFVLVEAAGLVLIWLAADPVAAAVGALLTGFGYSLVYPGLGAEALRRAPPQSRGLVMGIYTAFLDVALGLGSPALGLIAGWAGLGTVFLASAAIVLGAAAVAAGILFASARRAPTEHTSVVLRHACCTTRAG